MSDAQGDPDQPDPQRTHQVSQHISLLHLPFRQRFVDAHGAPPKAVDDCLLAVDNPLLLLLHGPDPLVSGLAE